MTAARLLVIEDEAAIRTLLKFTLEKAGFAVTSVESAEQALAEIRSELPALILLDLMLPGMSGITLAQRLRAEMRTRELPLIMLTALADETERVRGLDLGADDYITKPFSPKELVARINAVLRRRAPHLGQNAVRIGALELDPVAHRVSHAGNTLELGPTEFSLLHYLMTHPNRTHSRNQLLDALRGDSAELNDRTIDVYIRRLRAGLGEHGISGESLIETVRGIGYKLNAPS